MVLRMSDLSANARHLAQASVAYMDARWDEPLGLIRYDPQRPTFYPPRLRRPPEAAPNHATRGAAWYALGLLLRDGPTDRARAVAALEGVLRNQFVAPGKPYHGTWRLFDASEEPDDPETATDWRGWDSNWRQFIGITLAIILDEYRDRLPGDLAAGLDRAVVLAVEGEILEARLRPTYTNIALMRSPLDVWAGVRYGRPDWVRQGEEWAEEIHRLFRRHDAYDEYNSPTYYGVDLYALGFWRRYAPSEQVRDLGRAMEAALWRDIAALYHAGLRNLCGPFFRSYGMDMARYSAGVAHEMWAAVGPEHAPHPPVDSPEARSSGMTSAIMDAVLGGAVPDEALPALRAFPGEHTFRKTISDGPEISVSAWLGERAMIGAAWTSGTRAAEGQFHPATLHWLAPGGGVNWMRLCAGNGVDATAEARTLHIACGGDPAFHVYAPGGSLAGLTRARWDLPGLTVQVESDGAGVATDEIWNAMRITYPGATRLTLRI